MKSLPRLTSMAARLVSVAAVVAAFELGVTSRRAGRGRDGSEPGRGGDVHIASGPQGPLQRGGARRRLRWPRRQPAAGAGLLGGRAALARPVRIAEGGCLPLQDRVLRRGGRGPARRLGPDRGPPLPWWQPAVPRTVPSAYRPTIATSRIRTARRSSGWATPGGWDSASASSGRRTSRRWPPTGSRRASTSSRSSPGCIRTCRRSTTVAATRPGSRGRRITAASGPSTSTRPTSGCTTSPMRTSSPASSGPGATTCRGWASRR